MEEPYPRTVLELERRFSTEESCRAYLFALRWPKGFVCPRCRGGLAWPASRGRLVCQACRHQTSVTAGTIFQDTRTPLATWFLAIWHVTSQKNVASAANLQRILGLRSYQTAWTWLPKLRRAMVRPGRDKLHGRVEVDETYVGGEDPKEGAWIDPKAVVAIAAEEDGAGIGRIRLAAMPRPTKKRLHRFVLETIEPPHGRQRGLPGARSDRLPAPPNGLGATESQERGEPFVAAGPSRGLAPEVVVARHAPRGRQRRTLGLLPGRIHLPLQPPHLTVPRQAVLPPTPASGPSPAKPASRPDRRTFGRRVTTRPSTGGVKWIALSNG